jgi:pimeloyl-ACP methyl ester carboxylesterase
MEPIPRHTEAVLGLPSGLRIAIKQWGDEHAHVKILAVHGWLDSAATWDNLAPLLVSSSLSVRLVCMDFAGHGLSSHKSADALGYDFCTRVVELSQVADALHWDKFILMGHSMGAAIATIAASVMKDRFFYLCCAY